MAELDKESYRNMFEINYSQLIQYEILEKLVTFMESVFSSTYFLRKIEDDLGLELEAKRDDPRGKEGVLVNR